MNPLQKCSFRYLFAWRRTMKEVFVVRPLNTICKVRGSRSMHTNFVLKPNYTLL